MINYYKRPISKHPTSQYGWRSFFYFCYCPDWHNLMYTTNTSGYTCTCTVETQYNEGSRNYQNLFSITRFCYIEVHCKIFYYYWVKKIIRYIKVPLYLHWVGIWEVQWWAYSPPTNVIHVQIPAWMLVPFLAKQGFSSLLLFTSLLKNHDLEHQTDTFK